MSCRSTIQHSWGKETAAAQVAAARAFCTDSLQAVSGSDKRFCSPACKQADRRRRRRQAEAVAIGLWYHRGAEAERAVRCPAIDRGG